MTAPTHTTFGLFLTAALFSLFALPLYKDLPAVGVTVLGSLLPDIDTPNSALGRLLPFLSIPIERRFGHRTVTHSLVWWLGLGVVSLPLVFVRPACYAGLLIGYASHLLADCMTKSGVPLFYPQSAVCVLPGSSRYRIRTGSLGERMVLLVLLGLLMLVFPLSRLGGTWRALRYLLATQSMAYTDFREATTESMLEFKGRWRVSRRKVEGEALILEGTASKFLIAFKGATWVYGEQGDIMPDRSRVRFTKKPIRIDTVVVGEESFAPIRDQLPSGAFISGQLESSRPFDLVLPLSKSQHQSVKATNQELKFEYAPAARIAPLAPRVQINPEQVAQLQGQIQKGEADGLALQIQRPPVHYVRLREAEAALAARRQELATLQDSTLTFTGVLYLRRVGGKQ